MVFRAYQLLFLFISFLFPFQGHSQPSEKILKAGTPIYIETISALNSQESAVGQAVNLKVLYEVKVDGQVVVPVGAGAIGKVDQIRKPKGWGKPGFISIKIEKVFAVDGTSIPVTAISFENEGENEKSTAIGVSIGGCIFVPVIGVLSGFFVKGEHAKIHAGTSISTTVITDTQIRTD